VENDILQSLVALSSTTLTYSASKAIEFGKIMKNKGHYAV